MGSGPYQTDNDGFTPPEINTNPPPHLANAVRVNVTEETIGVGATATYVCDRGFRLRSGDDYVVSTCIDIGNWSPIRDVCEGMICSNIYYRLMHLP